jgi:hypothetical protein
MFGLELFPGKQPGYRPYSIFPAIAARIEELPNPRIGVAGEREAGHDGEYNQLPRRLKRIAVSPVLRRGRGLRLRKARVLGLPAEVQDGFWIAGDIFHGDLTGAKNLRKGRLI